MDLSRRLFLSASAGAALLQAAPFELFDDYFLTILRGYLRNAHRTSPSMAVCDFEGGTILKNSVGKSGKTYDSVTRMLPAMAAWVAGGRAGKTPELLDSLRLTFINAFDPQHEDYWLPVAPGTQNQRQVESGIVAWSLWLLRDELLPKLTPAQRTNIQAWLASCTQHPVRSNNWAWFTAVNQAVRLDLAKTWKEFSGDEKWMLEDLQSLDTLAVEDGWFTDSRKERVFDYYNFWVFASHFLYWNKIVGKSYPQWSERFGARLKLFIEKTPYFFGENGSHVLFGRSLIYRFAVLTPMVLAYEQGFWPHTPGMLRRIVRRNLEFHSEIGSFDAIHGKLRETYSRWGTHDICDSYIDNGHPYWGMQAFAFFLIPRRDPFWTSVEHSFPVEKADFNVAFEPLHMRLVGSKQSGQVRWYQAACGHGGVESQDKYTKLVYSTHFPFNIIKQKDRATWDSTVVFRDPATGAVAARNAVQAGTLTPQGHITEWTAELSGKTIRVRTEIVVRGEFEHRTHVIEAPAGVEILEGSAALGLEANESLVHGGGHTSGHGEGHNERIVHAARSGHAIAVRAHSGQTIEVIHSFDEQKQEGVNVIYPRMTVLSLKTVASGGPQTLKSTHYASPKPLGDAAIRAGLSA